MDNEGIDMVMDHMKRDLKALQARKKRADSGIKRSKYKSDLPIKYRGYLNRANKKGLVFELTVEEFTAITMHSCVYCGSTSKIGVDRKDNSEGYTLSNSQPCCTKCNMMKYMYDHEEFLSHVLKIVNWSKK